MQHRDEQAMLFHLLDKLDYEKSITQVTMDAAIMMGDFRFDGLKWKELETLVILNWTVLHGTKLRRR